MAYQTNRDMNINKLEEDINKLLLTFPPVCPPHLKGSSNSSRFSIGGQILTSEEFLSKWKEVEELKQRKVKGLRNTQEDTKDIQHKELHGEFKRGKGRPKKEMPEIKTKKQSHIPNIQEEGISDDFTQRLEDMLQEHIQHDALIRKAFAEEIDEEEMNEESEGSVDEIDHKLVNNYQDDDDIQRKYLFSTTGTNDEKNSPIIIESDDDKPSKNSLSLKEKIKEEGFSIRIVKGDGVY
jgi:hypothetical protein